MSLNAHFTYWVIFMPIKLNFIWKVFCESSFWNRGSRQLGNWLSTILVAGWLAIKGLGPTAELGNTLMNVVLTVLWTWPWGRTASEMLREQDKMLCTYHSTKGQQKLFLVTLYWVKQFLKKLWCCMHRWGVLKYDLVLSMWIGHCKKRYES